MCVGVYVHYLDEEIIFFTYLYATSSYNYQGLKYGILDELVEGRRASEKLI